MRKEEKYNLVYELFERYVEEGGLSGRIIDAVSKVKNWQEDDGLEELEQRFDEAIDTFKKERNRIRVFKDVAKRGNVDKLKFSTDLKDISKKHHDEQKEEHSEDSEDKEEKKKSAKDMNRLCSYKHTPITEEMLRLCLKKVNNTEKIKKSTIANEAIEKYDWSELSVKTSVETLVKERVYSTLEYAIERSWVSKTKSKHDKRKNVYQLGNQFENAIEKFNLQENNDFDVNEYLKKDKKAMEHTLD